MENKKPLKRHESLKPLSREHHHGLLLCFKIREGQKKGIEPQRIKAYTNFFYKTQLIPHFAFEEKEVFPLLGAEDDLVKQALAEHKRLESLFFENENLAETQTAIEKELQAHIRFEERVLFTKIQETTNEENLAKITTAEDTLETPNPDDWADKFWAKGVE